VPIVVLTGLSDEAFAQEMIRAEAQRHLVKGQIEGTGLLQALRERVYEEVALAPEDSPVPI
jgi:AmiR/NasT family two-component response regulator